MANILHELLNIRSHHLTSDIHELESMTGHQGKDIALAADIIAKQHLALKALGLDPRDTAAPEVYYGLRSLALLHNRFLQQRFEIGAGASNDQIVEAVFHSISKLNTPRKVWAVKQATVRRLLKKQPPKRTLKLLGYRSFDSMLKREPVAHVLATAYKVESAAWHRRYGAQYNQLTPVDFEERKVQLCLPRNRHWSQVGMHLSSQLQTNIIDVKELGAVVVLPLPNRAMPGLCLALSLLLLTHIEELRMYSAFFKSQQTSVSFGESISRAITGKELLSAQVGRQTFHWRLLHAYMGSQSDVDGADIQLPHLSVEDVAWRNVERHLSRLEPALDFWTQTNYVGYVSATHPGKPVSFNLMDVLLSTANNCAFPQHVVSHMQSSLWDELLMRYMSSHYVRTRLIAQLDHGDVSFDGNQATYVDNDISAVRVGAGE